MLAAAKRAAQILGFSDDRSKTLTGGKKTAKRSVSLTPAIDREVARRIWMSLVSST
jgi:hypothetical protein